MNKLILLTLAFASFGLFGQTPLNLNMTYVWNGNAFNLGQQYTDDQGTVVEVNRVQFYLSGFRVTHDGGQTTDLTGTYVLGSANVPSNRLSSANVTTVEGISFDLGVDAATNHLDPNQYSLPHPLAIQTPSMHWGWTSGYNFLVIEGMADTDGDNIVDAPFEFHAVGDDSYLRNVTPITVAGVPNGNEIDIPIYVNVADWVKNVNLQTAGFNHGVFPVNETIMNNTNTYTVFDANSTLSVDELKNKQSNVYVNYSLPYAPTIFYKFPTTKKVDLQIVDMSGKTVLSEKNMVNAGNYFIKKELAPGTYIANFKDDKGLNITEKFIVR